MIFNLFIDASGMEQLTLGRQLYSWHFTLRPETKEEAETEEIVPPTGAYHLGWTEATLPPTEFCRKAATEALKARLTTIRAEAYIAETEIQDRLDALLALTFEECSNG